MASDGEVKDGARENFRPGEIVHAYGRRGRLSCRHSFNVWPGQIQGFAAHALAVRGMLVEFGMASGDPPDINPFELAPRAWQLAWRILPRSVDTRGELVSAAVDLFDAVTAGVIDATPTRIYPGRRNGLREERRTTGAAVLRF